MFELSLFSGAGGGLLGTHHFLGWTPVGYVEIDDYCQRVLRRRIDDGYLPAAPLFGDVRAFLSDGYAESYQGMVDVIAAGFPCQPFSVAGLGLAGADSRNLWPETLAVLRLVRPRYALLENVPGLLSGSHGYFGRVLGELAESGFDARWGVLGADDVGAPHRRKRLWIAAISHAEREQLRDERGRRGRSGREGTAEPRDDGEGKPMADADGTRQLQPGRCFDQERRWSGDGRQWWATDPAELPDPDRETWGPPVRNAKQRPGDSAPGEWTEEPGGCDSGQDVPNSDHSRREKQRGAVAADSEHASLERRDLWPSESRVGRVAHGMADRVDRLSALGNGQVPAVVAAAWEMLRWP